MRAQFKYNLYDSNKEIIDSMKLNIINHVISIKYKGQRRYTYLEGVQSNHFSLLKSILKWNSPRDLNKNRMFFDILKENFKEIQHG